MSITVRGVSTFSFIRSTSVVPPATYRTVAPCCAVSDWPAVAIAASACSGLRRWNSSMAGIPGQTNLRLLPNLLNRGDDILIGPAPADVAGHHFLHVGVIRPDRLLHQGHAGHDLPGSAVAALIAVMLDERFLKWMQIVRLAEAFDGGDLVAVVHGGEAETTVHPPPVHVNGTRSALAVIAAFLRACQIEAIAKAIQQRRARIDFQAALRTVDGQRYRDLPFNIGRVFRHACQRRRLAEDDARADRGSDASRANIFQKRPPA